MTALLDLVQADVTLRRSSSRELAGPCPKCGGNDRFTVTPDAGSDGAGLWWCRGCNAGGDAVSYLREVRGLSYRDACSLLERDPGERTQPPRPREQRPAIEVKACPPPPDPWQERAEKLTAWAQTNMHAEAGERSRAYLAGRGLDGDALSQHRLGYVPQNLFRDRAEWGLPEELREDGKPKKLFIPAGIVIPCLDGTGHVVRVRIRREAADDGPRYHTLAGSSSRCLVAGTGPAVVIVESDLDALLLGVVAGDLVRAVSLGSAQSRPDEDAGAIVEAASVVLVSLDSDKAGAAAAWSKWTGAMRATRWPIPPECGKDPGDAYRAGYDLREWVQDGLVDAAASSNSSESTRTHETAAPAVNFGRFSTKRAEPAEPSPNGDGVGGQDAGPAEPLFGTPLDARIESWRIPGARSSAECARIIRASM